MNFIKNISQFEKLITPSFLNLMELNSSSLFFIKNKLDEFKTTTIETSNLIHTIFNKNHKSVVVIPSFFAS